MWRHTSAYLSVVIAVSAILKVIGTGDPGSIVFQSDDLLGQPSVLVHCRVTYSKINGRYFVRSSGDQIWAMH